VADQRNKSHELKIPESIAAHPAWFRLVEQRDWYDRKSQHCQRWHKGLRITQIVLASLIPTTSLLPADYAKWAASAFGVLIAVLEGVQHLNQYAFLWFSYRATAERLKHEQYLCLSCAGIYKGLSDVERMTLLAERVEEHVSAEHANWFNETRRAAVAHKPEDAK